MNCVTNKIEYSQIDLNNLGELVKLIKLYENVFEMETFKYPSQSYLKKILKNVNTIFLVARYENDVIGGLTAHQLASTYFEANEVYVYESRCSSGFPENGNWIPIN